MDPHVSGLVSQPLCDSTTQATTHHAHITKSLNQAIDQYLGAAGKLARNIYYSPNNIYKLFQSQQQAFRSVPFRYSASSS